MTESENIAYNILKKNNLIKIIKIILKHKQLYQYRDMSYKGNIVRYIFFYIILTFFYWLVYITLSEERIHFFFLIVLSLDFIVKFLFKDICTNILPYLIIPFKKKTLVKSILLIDSVSIWNLYCCISIGFLLYIDFFAENQYNLFLFWINIYLLFTLNSYYIIAIKNTFNRIVSLLLLPFFLLSVFLVYILLYSDILCTIITSLLIVSIFHSDIHIIIRKVYKQLNEQSL